MYPVAPPNRANFPPSPRGARVVTAMGFMLIITENTQEFAYNAKGLPSSSACDFGI